MSQLSLTDAHFAFLNQGALIQEISLDHHNIVLSLPTSSPYLAAPYFGETIGRVANRIAHGRIDDLNGRAYELSANERGVNHLHGGVHGWGHKHFDGPVAVSRGGRDAIFFTYTSPDGDEGYPGTVEIRVWYTVFEEADQGATKSVLDVEYEVEFTGDECDETVVHVTNHSYFNISPGPTIEGTELTLSTTDHLQTNASGIPTGKIIRFPAIETGQKFSLGAKEPVIDHCFVLQDRLAHASIDTRARSPHRLVSASHRSSGVHLDIYSTEPAFQLYTGDFINVPASEHGPARAARSGFCVEPGRCINAINVPEWRSQVLLRQGHSYGSRNVYKIWTSSVSPRE